LFPEFVEMLFALCEEGADYLIVGGYAVGVHAEPRATKDLDILVRPSAENAERVMRALARFGAARLGVTIKDLATPGLIFQIGVAPRRIDIITEISEVSFDEAWESRVGVNVVGLKTPMTVLGRNALIKNKRATGRPQDLADVAKLESVKAPRTPKKRAKKKSSVRRRKSRS
jgi:hypothetical protein